MGPSCQLPLRISTTVSFGALLALLSIIVGTCFCACIAPQPYALSPVYLQYLENVERKLYNQLKSQSLTNPDHTDDAQLQASLQRYLQEYESNMQNQTEISYETLHQGHISSNPILSLQMINRFVKYFKSSGPNTKILEGIIAPNVLPKSKEVEDAMDGLLRVQYIYDLDAYQIANGILQDTHTSARLNAGECFELGKLAQENEFYTLALQWYDVTLHKLQNTNKDQTATTRIKAETVLRAIRETLNEHNDEYEESMESGDLYSFSKPIHSTNYSEIAHLSLRKSLSSFLTEKELDVRNPNYINQVEANMLALCNGANLQTEQLKATLKCYLDTTTHPYWKINPLKIEVLSESPRIIQMYNIFSDSWIAYLQNKSYSELVRAPQPPEATPRTAAYAWFDDSAIPELPISKVVSFITGLNVEGKRAAEELQVAAYAFGAHVAPHHDSFYLGDDDEDDPVFKDSGNQMSTFLVYLNEVELGGLTAFPLVGISIKPVKNSAVLWYTKLKNGNVDNRTLHAACPVIKGHKWIATKWTRIGENILKRPCGLRPEE